MELLEDVNGLLRASEDWLEIDKLYWVSSCDDEEKEPYPEGEWEEKVGKELAKKSKQVEPQLKQLVEWLEIKDTPTLLEFLQSLLKQLLQELLEDVKTRVPSTVLLQRLRNTFPQAAWGD